LKARSAFLGSNRKNAGCCEVNDTSARDLARPQYNGEPATTAADRTYSVPVLIYNGSRKFSLGSLIDETRHGRFETKYIARTIILDIIYRSIFYLKHDISEAGLCLRLEVEPTEFGPVGRASPYIHGDRN
jgi:hypothetical protein